MMMQMIITIDNNNQIHFRETEVDTKAEEKAIKKILKQRKRRSKK